ncbi:putative amidoligase domain-containing protein [Paenibacillus sp. GYB003]|uniref:putative amidoligase domain-containing protein n=1 Tax=Paenibacillus sp. GYB003 TaxID=2994392 RepID=UPI002F96C8C3
MDGIHAEARRLGLNAEPIGRTSRETRPGQAAARLLGYSEESETGGDFGITHRYRFLLFQLETIAVYRSAANCVYAAPAIRRGTLYSAGGSEAAGGEWLRADPDDAADPKQRRARKAAARLLFLAGLDYGMVDIGIRPGGRPLLLAIEPFPAMEAPLAGRLAEALGRYRDAEARERERDPGLPNFRMGADPEFLLTNADGKVVPASAYLPRQGRAGCDVVRIGGKVMYPLAELRPRPSADPLQLVGHVRQALAAASRLIPDTPGVKWLAGGMPAKGFALGGHIHLSGVSLRVPLLRALDNYLALPLVLIEDERSSARRPRYGIPGDFRRQPHGGFEYRTLPSWLVSPRVAKGALALAALVAKRCGSLRARPLLRPDVLSGYFAGDKETLRGVVKPLMADIRGLPDYAEYAGMIAPLFAMIENGERWDESADIRAAWKIGSPVAGGR